MAAPHHHHQDSLQQFLNLSSSPPLADNVRNQADDRFHQIVEYFSNRDPDSKSKFNRPKLVELVYRYAISQKSKENVLRAFFRAMELPMEGGLINFSNEKTLLLRLIGFADHLVNNFFMPLRAATAKTPQPTPHYRSATLRSSSRDFVGTLERLSTLRGDCLIRDRHRCIISRAFDITKASERETPEGQILDDDGKLVKDDNVNYLEVAHILPHSLNDSQKTALEILNMFDNNITHLINSVEIDRPCNALTLTLSLHRAFGNFDVYFTPIPNRTHTYEIKTFLRTSFHRVLPVTRELYLTTDRNIEPPSPRLLALHCAITHILHLSGAAGYIDKIIRSMDEQIARCDGSTELGQLVQLRMNRWVAGGKNL
ncbi:hypothetical protein NOR_07407 [Metarhizium rileyi]|uniref:HNH nuclease domain-containing protein n=1 Tax=Metarhizium rileyi (strain RCEF 4871) TaxID=1649241 RepID=A0A166YGQ5_METRR|nr:hypothetical protein NOR_07407 [Metarhizium rileyi RCEF 4871]